MNALLLMDCQRMVVNSYAVDKAALLGRVKRFAVAARNSGAMVLHVVAGFQLGELIGQIRRIVEYGRRSPAAWRLIGPTPAFNAVSTTERPLNIKPTFRWFRLTFRGEVNHVA